MEKEYIPCGGCGATEPIQRCIGCFHPFESTPKAEPKIETATWLNLADHFTEDWEIMHCRYADDKRKLDTDLFELSDGWLIKKGGIGKLELHEVEYMAESKEKSTGPRRVKASDRLPGLKTPVKWRQGGIEMKANPVWYMVLDTNAEYLSECEWLDEGAGEKEGIDLPAFVQYIRENYKPSKEAWKDKYGIALLSDEGIINMYISKKEVKP
jgi:hypothetical protein